MLEPGYRLKDRYQLQVKLGQDASRQTWRALDLNQSSLVVIKLLALSPTMQWDESKLFEREAQVLQKLDHPRIPKYLDYFFLEQLPGSRFSWFCLVQTCIPGSSLQELLDRGQRFTETEIEKLAIEVLTILIYLHDLEPPVLHRDIKPSNLVWGEDDRIYLVDFGAVQDQAMVEGVTFTVVGTYGYVPMEQFGGRSVPASDLYALGATLVHLLTGRSPADLPQHNSRLQFADQVSLDSGFVLWIGRLLEPNLADRFTTARQALSALENRHNLSLPPVHRQPTASRIQVTKTPKELVIQIPPRGWQALSPLYLLGTVSGICASWNWMEIVENLYLMLPLILVLIVFSIVGNVTPALVATEIHCDRERFKIRWKILGFASGWKWAWTEDINSQNGISEQIAKGSKGITIQVGSQQFTTNPMAEVERLWLIQEFKDWLTLS